VAAEGIKMRLLTEEIPPSHRWQLVPKESNTRHSSMGNNTNIAARGTYQLLPSPTARPKKLLIVYN